MKKEILYIIGAIILALGIIKAFQNEPKIVTRTVTKTLTVHDTIKEFKIIEKPVKVYITKIKTVKGKDSIVYVSEPSDDTIETKQYNTVLKSNNATATLKITANELFDVSGVITYPEKESFKIITKYKPQSGLFIYGAVQYNVDKFNPEIGLMFQFKNSMMVTGGLQYSNYTKTADFKVGLGIKLL